MFVEQPLVKLEGTHCIHWRLTTEDWILTYCKKGGMNSVAIMIPSISLIITVRQYVEVTIKWSRAGI